MAQLTCVGFAQTTVGTTATALNTLAAIPGGASTVEIAVEAEPANGARIGATAAIRWRPDGTAPTTSVGNPVASGGTFAVEGKLSNISIIAQAGTATLNITYYG